MEELPVQSAGSSSYPSSCSVRRVAKLRPIAAAGLVLGCLVLGSINGKIDLSNVAGRAITAIITMPNPIAMRTHKPESVVASASVLPEHVVQILEPYFHSYDLRAIRVHEGIPRYVLGKPRGYASKTRIYLEPGTYDFGTASGIALIGHEALHCRQYSQFGTLRFRWKYLGEYLSMRWRRQGHEEAYWNISFEREAVALQRRIFEDLRSAGYKP
jgi:hypothetical protein